MAKAQKKSACKIKRNKKLDFSDSELNVAEQLIQLSGDSDYKNNNNNNNGFRGSTASERSDGNSTNVIISVPEITRNSSKIDDEDQTIVRFEDQTIARFEPRKRRKFKSLCEIYGLT